jgi:hypothetical protein
LFVCFMMCELFTDVSGLCYTPRLFLIPDLGHAQSPLYPFAPPPPPAPATAWVPGMLLFVLLSSQARVTSAGETDAALF